MDERSELLLGTEGRFVVCEISVPRGDECEDDSFLGYSAV
jgi:hypothetical protein